jgi:hypothetical protein
LLISETKERSWVTVIMSYGLLLSSCGYGQIWSGDQSKLAGLVLPAWLKAMANSVGDIRGQWRWTHGGSINAANTHKATAN